MKNWLSWIVGGSVAIGVSSYASLRDPLQDLWISTRSVEKFLSVSTMDGDHENLGCAVESGDEDTLASRSWLVQQPGSSQYVRESQNDHRRTNHRNHYTTLRAFKDSVGDHWKSTVQILENSQQIALGAIVTADGFIVTKASEVPDHKIEVRLYDGSKAEGIVKSRRQDLDLALVKIERTQLPAITWNTTLDVPVGGWLVSADVRSLPVAIGVLSVASRNVPREKAVLGVTLAEPPTSEKGALVENVVEGSGADRAGVRTGDVIQRINGDALSTRQEVLNRLSGLSAGQRVDVVVQRDGSKETTLTAQMMDLSHSLLDPTEMEVNGEISARATGFQKVFQHDSVLAPFQCGGPIIDVYGNAVGINIARAGRVSSYAIPAKMASPAIAEMLAVATGKQNSVGQSIVQASGQSQPVSSAISLPMSVPSGIPVEALKPEVVLPSFPTRP
jgi:serine protease Do